MPGRPKSVILLLLVALAAALVAPVRARAATLTDDLVAYYALDGNANDAAGAASNGTLQNGATYGADRFGTASSALLLDGNDDYVSVASLGETGVGDFTVSARFRLAAHNPAGRTYILDMRGGGGEIPALIVDRGASDVALLDFYSGYAETGYDAGDIRGEWHQMTLVRQGGTQVNYFDGQAIGTPISISAATQSWSVTWRIGTYYTQNTAGDNYWINGSVDDVAMWRRALTAEEAQAFFQSGLAAVPEPGTLAIVALAGAILRRRRRD